MTDQHRAILSDFGVSRVLDEIPSGLSTSNFIGGTLRYCCPELVKDSEDKKSLPNDIWAWGCTVLEVSVGKAHCHGETPTLSDSAGFNRLDPLRRPEIRAGVNTGSYAGTSSGRKRTSGDSRSRSSDAVDTVLDLRTREATIGR